MKTASFAIVLVMAGCAGGGRAGSLLPGSDAATEAAADQRPDPIGCVPGASPTCACATGGTGAQVCLADRTFGPCVCPDGGDAPDFGAVGADAGADATEAKPVDAKPPCVDTGLCPYGIELKRRCETDGGLPMVNSCSGPRWCELCRLPPAFDNVVCQEGSPDLAVGYGLPPTCVAACSECWPYGT